MSERAERVIEMYEEATDHFKKAVVMFGLSILAALGAVFYFKRT